jgi:hypothetical protein
VSDYEDKLSAATRAGDEEPVEHVREKPGSGFDGGVLSGRHRAAVQGSADGDGSDEVRPRNHRRGANPARPSIRPPKRRCFEVLWVKNRLISVKLHAADSSRRGRPDGRSRL